MTEPQPFNRDLFLTANRTKLFTADEVVKFIEKYSTTTTSAEKVLEDMWRVLDSEPCCKYGTEERDRIRAMLRELRQQAERDRP